VFRVCGAIQIVGWSAWQNLSDGRGRRLGSGFVVAGGPARFAVQEAIRAETDVELGLAEDAEFFAGAAIFRLLTLRANDLTCRFRGHGSSVVRGQRVRNITEVTGGPRACVARQHSSDNH